MRFDQDVELALTGKLIVKISLGGPSASRADHLQQLYMVRPDYLRRCMHVVGPAGPLAAGTTCSVTVPS